MLPVKINRAVLVGALEYAAPDAQEFIGNFVPLIVIDEQPVTFQFAGTPNSRATASWSNPANWCTPSPIDSA